MTKPIRAWQERAADTARGAGALALLVAVYALARTVGWTDAAPNALFALGLLLLGGSIAGRVASFFGLPKLTGFLAAGIIAGPHVTHAIDHEQVKNLSVINALALALIALEAGAELTMAMLRRTWRSVLAQCLTHALVLGVGLAIVFGALGALGHLDVTRGTSLHGLIALAALWGVIGVTKSPAATLAVLKETRARGPVSDVALGVVVLFDILVLVLFAAALMLAQAALSSSPLSLHSLGALGVDLVASVAAGTTFGLAIALYFWAVGVEKLLFLLTIAYGITAFCSYFHYDTLLVFAAAGFIVTNLTRQGPELVESSERIGGAVMVVFFATAGAHLDLQVLKEAWPVALGLAGARLFFTYLASRVGHALVHDDAVLHRYAWTAFVSQAGVTIGLATVAGAALGERGASLATLVIAVVAVNEVVGPVIFKLGLTRAGEVPSEEPAQAAQPPEPLHPRPPLRRVA